MRDAGLVDVETKHSFRYYSIKEDKKKLLNLILTLANLKSDSEALELIYSVIENEISAYIGNKKSSELMRELKSHTVT